MRYQINKALVPMKAHYFLFNAGTGPIVPYLSIYAKQLGFSSVIVGLIYTILPVFGMVAKPVFGTIADRFHCQKIIFLVAQLVTAVAFLSIFYSPKVPQDIQVRLIYQNGSLSLQNKAGISIDSSLVDKISSKKLFAACQLDCALYSGETVLCTDASLSELCNQSTPNTASFTGSIPTSKIYLAPDYSGSDVSVYLPVGNITQDGRGLNLNVGLASSKTSCDMKCNDNDINLLMSGNQISDADVYRMYQFWVFLTLMIVAWIGQAVTVSIGDAICFELLGDKPNRYGYQRMFGALGWGILSSVSGIVVDIVSKDKAEDDYSVCFYLAAGFLVLDFLASINIKYKQTKVSTNILRDVRKLLVEVRIVVFLTWCIAVGMCTGLMWQFLLWLVEDRAKSQNLSNVKTLQGVIMGVQCLGGELPFFFLSGKILKKIGHVSSMSVVLAALGVRFILYSVIPNPWYFIPLEFSNGLTFGLFYACMASYASIIAPPGTEATMQGLVGAVFEGVGVSLGSFLAGLAWNDVGGQKTFLFFGVGALTACAVHFVAQRLLRSQDASIRAPRKDSLQKIRLDDQKQLTSVEDSLISK
ncbi:sugar baby transporter [Rhynchophorus ferrugineus]|uniref:sugar baby transporter n=1 Tax=Rhynchophorus ferrugineus TaxID=354439 RepID=UPI003FCD5DF3